MGLREIVDKAAQGFGLLVLVLIFAPMTLSLLLVLGRSFYLYLLLMFGIAAVVLAYHVCRKRHGRTSLALNCPDR